MKKFFLFILLPFLFLLLAAGLIQYQWKKKQSLIEITLDIVEKLI